MYSQPTQVQMPTTSPVFAQPGQINIHPSPAMQPQALPAVQPQLVPQTQSASQPLTLKGYPTFNDYDSPLLSMVKPVATTSKPTPGNKEGVSFVSSKFKYDHSRQGAAKDFMMEYPPLFTPKGIQRSDKYNKPSWYIMVIMDEVVPSDPDTTVTQQQVNTNIKVMGTLAQLRQDTAVWLEKYKYDWGAGNKTLNGILESIPEFATHPPISKEDKRPDFKKSKTMFLKLANKVGEKGVYKTRFYTPKSKDQPSREIPWEELENVSFTLIPLVTFDGMYLSGKSVFQCEVKSAIILPGIKIREFRSSQQDTLNRLEEEHPEYADMANSDLAKLAAMNQSRLAAQSKTVNEEPDTSEERSSFASRLTAHKNPPKNEEGLVNAPVPGTGLDGLPPIGSVPVVPAAVYVPNPGVGVPIVQDTRLG